MTLIERVRAALEAAGADTSPVESMVPVVAGWVTDVPAGRSKIGGNPDLPAGFEWPHEGSRMFGRPAPLGFICQIDLADLPAADEVPADRRLPAEGMLYLFSIVDSDTAYGWNIDHDNTAFLHLPDPGPLEPLAFPENLPEKARIRQRPLAFAASLVCEEPGDLADGEDPDDIEDDDPTLFAGTVFARRRFGGTAEKAVEEALLAAGSHSPDLTMLGNPHFFRAEAAHMAEYDHGKQLELLGLPAGWVSREFGHGTFYVVIDRADLAAGRLGSAHVVFEPST